MHNHNTRALAARVLADVALRGASLRERLPPAQSQLSDPRDRALLTALASEGARWWLRFDPALDQLVQRPLRRREPELHALLVLGLVQLEILMLPPHAAVASTVDAARALERAGFAKLVNGVLRRWLRERDAHASRLDHARATRSAHPRWLVDALGQDWPEHADAILAANNVPAPPTLRVNARRATRETVVRDLARAGVYAAAPSGLRDALALHAPTATACLHGFGAGHFSVQDGAAQCAAECMSLGAGQRVLDACAAPGGKTCHMLERADIELLALDRDRARGTLIDENLHRLGLGCDVRVGCADDPVAWWDGRPFDRILLDAPCSATGVIRRHPDIKLHRRVTDIGRLVHEQSRLLAALWPLLILGGRLVYATCSVLRAENDGVVAAFLGAHADARPQPIALPAGRAVGAGWQILPGEGGLDGMYYAVLVKT